MDELDLCPVTSSPHPSGEIERRTAYRSLSPYCWAVLTRDAVEVVRTEFVAFRPDTGPTNSRERGRPERSHRPRGLLDHACAKPVPTGMSDPDNALRAQDAEQSAVCREHRRPGARRPTDKAVTGVTGVLGGDDHGAVDLAGPSPRPAWNDAGSSCGRPPYSRPEITGSTGRDHHLAG